MKTSDENAGSNEHLDKSKRGVPKEKLGEGQDPKQPKEGDEMVPLSAVQQMIDEAMAKNKPSSIGDIDALASAIAKASKKDTGRRGDRTAISEEEIPVEDIMEDPADFWAWGSGWGIYSEKRGGHSVMPPYRMPINFKHSYTQIKGSGKEKQVVYICAFQTRSRKVAEWLRKSNLFGVKFFEDLGSVDSVDMSEAQKYVDAATSISGLGQMDIIEKAKALGVKPSEDLEATKMQVISKIVESGEAEAQARGKQTAVGKDLSVEEKIKRNKTGAVPETA